VSRLHHHHARNRHFPARDERRAAHRATSARSEPPSSRVPASRSPGAGATLSCTHAEVRNGRWCWRGPHAAGGGAVTVGTAASRAAGSALCGSSMTAPMRRVCKCAGGISTWRWAGKVSRVRSLQIPISCTPELITMISKHARTCHASRRACPPLWALNREGRTKSGRRSSGIAGHRESGDPEIARRRGSSPIGRNGPRTGWAAASRATKSKFRAGLFATSLVCSCWARQWPGCWRGA
jgi:hypothetical protein